MRWRRRFRGVLGIEPAADVEHELAFHLEMRIRELIERGESPERARELALLRFGDYEDMRHECVAIDERRRRRMLRIEYLTEMRQDVGYALRMLRRTPGFTAVAVVTLALGIGANSTIFGVVRSVLLESLPFPSAERLYDVRTLYPDGTGYSLSPPDFMSIREDNRVFDRVEAYTGGVATLLGVGEPKEVRSARVSDGLLELLGLEIALGRGFLPEENQPGRGHVAVLDHSFWQRELGGAASVLGRTLILGDGPYTVVGVLGPGARLTAGGRRPWLNEADIHVPLEYDERFSAAAAIGRRGESLRVLGRARLGVSPEQIQADMRRIGTQLQGAFPESNERLTFSASSLRDLIVGDVRRPLLMMLGAVGFVLLVACANVANLLLARSSARQGELAVRAALGAGSGRLLRQLLTEAAVLGVMGGAAGLLIAYWGTRALVGARPADIPRLDEIGVDGALVLFSLGIGLATSLAFGALPALRATGGPLTGSLREGGRGAGSSGHRVRAGLLVAEMALAVVLLTGAGWLVRSFIELTRVDPGFEAEGGIALRITMQGDAYENEDQIRSRVASVLERVGSVPGVTVAGATTLLPLSGRGSLLNFRVEDAPPPPPDVNAEIGVTSVTPDYFRAIGTQLRRGRGFTDQDRADAPPVAVINEAAVRRWFAGEDPIGKRVAVGSARPEVVGVIADILQRDPGQPAEPELFRPYAQRPSRSVRVVVRTAGEPLALASAIRAEVRALDSTLPVMDVTSLSQLVSTSVARPRFYTLLLTIFAVVGLVLAATGVFGVTSYAVAQRSREISIRMALGARKAVVLRTIVGRAMMLAALGAAIGIAAALALGSVIQNQLFGVTLLDPVTLGVVVLVLIASAGTASVLPARRAAGLDPATALREG